MPATLLRTASDAARYDPIATAEALAIQLAADAVQRDRDGGHAGPEREWIRQSGLLNLSIPVEFGGDGASWATVYQVIRILARVDSALAHVFGFHHLQLAGILLYGTAKQQRHLLSATVEQRLFWGNALNPLDQRTTGVATSDGFVLDGVKSFCSGSVGSDWLTVSAWVPASGGALIGVIPTRQDGVQVHADWDAFGQRQTDSGNVHFTKVLLPTDLVLQVPAQTPTPQSTLRSQVAQLIMANLYLGIGQGAFDTARNYTREQSRAWFASGVDAARDDPFVQHRYGELWLLLRPAEVLADTAAHALDRAFAKGALLSARERGEVAVAVAEAKVLSHKAGVDISNQMFELTGARATSARFGYDRFWRNVRVHTLHDPVDYKLRDLGRYALDGSVPRTDGIFMSSASQALIQVQDAHKSFALPDGGVFQAVRAVSLEVQQGDIFGLIGKSGAGKSTLLRLINLLERPDSGSIVVAGQDLTRLGKRELRAARQNIGMIFQQFNLLQNATVYDNVAFPLRIHGTLNPPRLAARVDECLALVGLADKAGSYPAQLSGGQKQRAAIARALASRPSVLLCDEPTSALDAETTRALLDTLRDINQRLGVTIVIVSHELSVLGAICNRVAVIEDGALAEQFALADTSVARITALGRELAWYGTEGYTQASWKGVEHV